MRLKHEGDTHWFLVNIRSGQRVDVTAKQFKKTPRYKDAVGAGFLTKRPSKRARAMMRKLVWQ
jgi:hypothetical protein